MIVVDPNGGYSVTELGRRLVDDPADATLLRAAFLRVEAFRRLTAHFGSDLSQVVAHAVAGAVVGFGIGEARAKDAAAVAVRSWPGTPNERVPKVSGVVFPSLSAASPGTDPAALAIRRTLDLPAGSGSHEDSLAEFATSPMIAAILSRVPPIGDAWSLEDRDAWLDLFASAVRFLYPCVITRTDDPLH